MSNQQEEADVEVRKIDQENINKFGRLNARLHELRAEKDSHKVCVYVCACVV